MAAVPTLVCDWCPRVHGKNFAVRRVEITWNGEEPEFRDVCKKHRRWLTKLLALPKASHAAALKATLAQLSPEARRARTAKARKVMLAKYQRHAPTKKRQRQPERRVHRKKLTLQRRPPAVVTARVAALEADLLAILAKNRTEWLSRSAFDALGKEARVRHALKNLRTQQAITLRGIRATARYQITPKGMARTASPSLKKPPATSAAARPRAKTKPKPPATQAQASNGRTPAADLPAPAGSA
jgi:hypothetical protein